MTCNLHAFPCEKQVRLIILNVLKKKKYIKKKSKKKVYKKSILKKCTCLADNIIVIK